ncbi:pirin family protein [bacterium]|nr:pirin family protein [bacterium]
MDKLYRKISVDHLHYMEASRMHPANTYFHFSFAEYHNPVRMNFGNLRVLNDDDVQPQGGFATHPHRDMEIVSYVVGGKLTHRDSAGFHDTLGRGHVQTISAGTGVTHSELNEEEDWCRFLQIWILPDAGDLPVRYENHKFALKDRENKLLHIVGNSKSKGQAPLYVFQDVNLYVSELTDKNKSVSFSLEEGRQAYLNCFEGSINIEGFPSLGERDSLELHGKSELEISLASDNAHFILIEMKGTA